MSEIDDIEELSDLGLIPEPVDVDVALRLRFTLTEDTVLDADERGVDVASWLRLTLGPATGLPLPDGRGPDNAITLRLADAAADAADLGSEGYRLTVTATGVRLEAVTSAGLFYAAQTLRTLFPPAAFRRAPI